MMIQQLGLTQDSVIMDIGGGDGSQMQYFAEKANLKVPPLVLEPSLQMNKLSEQKSGITTFSAYTHEIIGNLKQLPP
jgi:cyclopropane fatty-acyl-phospholipid synthase-like methyltransferase